MKDKTCCFTGHRPEKLKRNEAQIKEALQKEIGIAVAEGFTSFLCGMARGADLWAAQLVRNLKKDNPTKDNPTIELICAMPYEGFEERWPLEWRLLYWEISAADYKKVFYPSFNYAAFQERNRWMVDQSARVIAVYNGVRGGTFNTIEYAKQRNIKVCFIPG